MEAEPRVWDAQEIPVPREEHQRRDWQERELQSVVGPWVLSAVHHMLVRKLLRLRREPAKSSK